MALASTRPPHTVDQQLSLYEGLVFRHATRIVEIVEDDLDDIRQFYRLKAWGALRSFDADKAQRACFVCREPCGDGDRCARCKYVFICLKNAEKDMLKKRRRGHAFIEDLGPTTGSSDGDGQRRTGWFEERFLSTDHEAVYGSVDEGQPLLPNTLTKLEVGVIVLLYRGYRQSEIARLVPLAKGELDRMMVSIREKMADWRPEAPASPAPRSLGQVEIQILTEAA